MPRKTGDGTSDWKPRVSVVKPRQGRAYWQFRWTDRDGGIRECASDVPASAPRKQAERAAARYEDELAKRRGPREPWETACDKYESLKMDGLRKGTKRNWLTARAHVERLLEVQYVDSLTSDQLDTLSLRLREAGDTPATIAGHLRYLRAFLNFCERKGWIERAPRVDLPAGAAKKKRSREISGEEFERVLMAADLVRKQDAPAWKRLLSGLWHSGLRIDELLNLHWTQGPLQVDTSREFPGFLIAGEGQKNGQTEWLPMAPSFYREFVEPIPIERRRGYLFAIPGRKREQISTKSAVRVVSAIGRRANVKTGLGDSKKTATSHDIGRRSFATRHKSKLSEWELAALMRHSDPATTATYYVGDAADELAKKLWEADSAERQK